MKNNKPKIACAIIVTISGAVLGVFLVPSARSWIFWEIAGGVLVALGCIGEMYWIFKKGPQKEAWLQHEEFEARKIGKERIFAVVVAIGVTMELIGLAHSIPEALRLEQNVAQLTQTNLVLRSNVAAFEFKLMQTSSNVVRIDPLNLPIASLTASVVLMERGTNRTSVDPNDIPTAASIFVTLNFGSSEQLKTNASWRQAHLICQSCDRVPSSAGTENNTCWLLSFGTSGLGQIWSDIPNSPVQSVNKWDIIRLDALFLPARTEILDGQVTLMVNGTLKKVFPIPPQKTRGFMEGELLNTVTVHVW